MLKVHGPISQTGDFYLSNASLSKKSFQLNQSNHFDTCKRLCVVQFPIPYCVVTITSHNFIHIFQRVFFSTVKFTRSNENIYELSSDTKISECLRKI